MRSAAVRPAQPSRGDTPARDRWPGSTPVPIGRRWGGSVLIPWRATRPIGPCRCRPSCRRARPHPGLIRAALRRRQQAHRTTGSLADLRGVEQEVALPHGPVRSAAGLGGRKQLQELEGEVALSGELQQPVHASTRLCRRAPPDRLGRRRGVSGAGLSRDSFPGRGRGRLSRPTRRRGAASTRRLRPTLGRPAELRQLVVRPARRDRRAPSLAVGPLAIEPPPDRRPSRPFLSVVGRTSADCSACTESTNAAPPSPRSVPAASSCCGVDIGPSMTLAHSCSVSGWSRAAAVGDCGEPLTGGRVVRDRAEDRRRRCSCVVAGPTRAGAVGPRSIRRRARPAAPGRRPAGTRGCGGSRRHGPRQQARSCGRPRRFRRSDRAWGAGAPCAAAAARRVGLSAMPPYTVRRPSSAHAGAGRCGWGWSDGLAR